MGHGQRNIIGFKKNCAINLTLSILGREMVYFAHAQ